MNDPYFTCIRKFLAETDLSIATPNTLRLTPPRTNDSALMDEVIKKYGKSPKKIREFNQCRLYLRVIYLSDLTNGAGTAVHPNALSSSYRDHVGQTKWMFPRQEIPPPKSWKTWKQLIRYIYIPTLEERKIIRPTTGAAPRRLDQQRPRAMEMASITKRKNGIQTRRN